MMITQDFKNISFKKRAYCAVCEEKLANPTIRLTNLPLTEIYTNKKPKKLFGFADQEFFLCRRCGHGQIGNIISPEILYTSSSYFFLTSRSKTATSANDVFLAFMHSILRGRKLDNIIEIGCSDLYLLNDLRSLAKKLYGIDPVLSGRERELSDEKITVIGGFFEDAHLEEEVPQNTLVISSHTLEHVEDPKKMIGSLLRHASDKTIFIHQFPSLEPMISDLRYDQIFHQHLHYFSLSSFFSLIEMLGGEIVDYTINYLHWGALMVAFKKKSGDRKAIRMKTERLEPKRIRQDYKTFQSRMRFTNEYLTSLSGEKIYGYGAALMLPILGYHLKNDFSSFECILDDDKSKEGLYYINLPVAITTPERVKDIRSSSVMITAYNTVRSVLPRVLSFKPKRIILPTHVI